jgi:hypothetical protein
VKRDLKPSLDNLGMGVLQMKRLSIFVVLALMLASCAEVDDRFDQFGYYKGEYRSITQRAFSYVYSDGVTEADIRQHAASQPYTDGGVTAVYYYSGYSGAKNPTQLADFGQVQDLMEDSHWSYRYWRALNGSESLKHRPL